MVREKEFYRSILRIALPSALQSLIGLLVVTADDVMVSSLDAEKLAMSAVAQTNAITAFFSSIILGLTSGASVLIAQYWGKQDTVRIKRVFSIVVALCGAISVITVLLVSLFPELLLRVTISGDKTDMMDVARAYFVIVCFSYIPYAISTALVGMLRSVEVVGITLITSILSLFTNVTLNWVLIFGKLDFIGIPAMGVRGAALATVIARVVELAVVWHYTFRVQKRLDITPRELRIHEKWLWRDYARYGLPVGIGDTQWALIGILKAVIIGRLAQEFIAANSITNTMMNLGTVFSFALSGGACVVVGKAVGSKEYGKARAYSNTIQVMFLCFGVLTAGIVILLRGPFVALYGESTPEVSRLAQLMIFVGALTLIGTTYHASCFVGINRGAGDGRFVMIVDMICGWLIVLPATLLAAFYFKWPPEIIFLCTRIDQTFKWIIAYFRLRGDKWIRNVTREAAAA